jgi:hypothetical protein
MRKLKKVFLAYILIYTVAGLCIWISISSTIQRFKCPKMTETEIFLNIPNSIVCDWKSCE